MPVITEAKAIILAIVAVFILGLIGTVWFQHHENEKLNEKIGTQTDQIRVLQGSVQSLSDDAGRTRQNTDELNQKTLKLREDVDRQQKVILDHDLGTLASKHPKMIEDDANKATADFLKNLENNK